MKNYYFLQQRSILAIILFLFFSYFNVTYAAPFFSITTSNKYIEIPVNTIGSVTYQVQNSTKALAKNIIYDITNPNNTGVSIDPTGTTCGKTLNPNQTCTLKILIAAGSMLRTLTLSPRVCTENGVVCSVPDSSNRAVVKIVNSSIPPAPSFSFNLSLNTVATDQHLQFSSLNLQNTGTGAVTLSTISATLSANIQNQVEICNASTSCTPPTGSLPSCSTGTVIAPGSSCLIWFHSLDSITEPLGTLTGTIDLNIQGDHPLNLNQTTFTANFGYDLYVGGNFSSIGGVPDTLRIAKWNGSSWSALNTGLPTFPAVLTLSIFQGDLFAGGTATGTNSRIVRWDGITFNPLSTGITNNAIFASTVYNNTLVLGGSFLDVGSADGDNIITWNGSTFNPLSTSLLNASVRSLIVYQNDLIVGGDFTNVDGVVAKSRIVRWNGSSYNAMDSGISNSLVVASAIVGNDLYVGGGFTDQYGATGDFVLRWNGTNFSPLSLVTAPDNSVSGLSSYLGKLILAGGFQNLGGVNGDNLSSFDVTSGTYFEMSNGTNNLNNSSSDVYEHNGILYIAGAFSSPENRIMQWTGTFIFPAGWTGSYSPLGSGLIAPNIATIFLAASSLTLQ